MIQLGWQNIRVAFCASRLGRFAFDLFLSSLMGATDGATNGGRPFGSVGAIPEAATTPLFRVVIARGRKAVPRWTFAPCQIAPARRQKLLRLSTFDERTNPTVAEVSLGIFAFFPNSLMTNAENGDRPADSLDETAPSIQNRTADVPLIEIAQAVAHVVLGRELTSEEAEAVQATVRIDLSIGLQGVSCRSKNGNQSAKAKCRKTHTTSTGVSVGSQSGEGSWLDTIR